MRPPPLTDLRVNHNDTYPDLPPAVPTVHEYHDEGECVSGQPSASSTRNPAVLEDDRCVGGWVGG